MELGLAPLCFECRHFAGVVPGVGWSCTAFRRIPVPILVKSHDHRQPYPGDGGLRFEPVPPVSEAQRRAMFAAASGHSTLGIPRKVGEEFVGKADDDAEDGGKDFLRSAKAFLRGLISWVSEEEAEGEHAADAEPPKGHAASVAFVTQDGEVLFVRRSPKEENWPSTWALPGGKRDEGESIEDCAQREAREEIGDCGFDGMVAVDQKRTPYGWDHTTYAVPVKDKFTPTLNDEHDAYEWRHVTDAPEPLHPGVRATIDSVLGGFGEDAEQEREPDGKFASVSHHISAAAKHKTAAESGRIRGTAQEAPHREAETAHNQARAAHEGYRLNPYATGEVVSYPFVADRGQLSHAANEKTRALGTDETVATREQHEGHLSATTREDIGAVGSKHREGMPERDFLGPDKTYPVKENGKYSRQLLLAAARRARMQGRADLARRADAIREREFGAETEAKDAETAHDPRTGQFTSGQHASAANHHKSMASSHEASASEHSPQTAEYASHKLAAHSHELASRHHEEAASRKIHPNFSRHALTLSNQANARTRLAQGRPVHDMDPDATGHFRITGQTDKNGDFAWAMRDGGQVGKGREVDNMARAVRSGRGLANVAGDMALDYSAFGALTLTPVLTAYDKAASVRSIDADGKMRVADSRISKATVNSYYGKEIPDYEKLGLDPEKKYMLYRDPEELKKAVDTFNNLPILSRHQPVTATDFPVELIIGATGTDAAFDGEYLTNSLAFWPKSAIDKIEDGEEKQISCAYRYVPDMQPGESPDGQKYDGRMTKLAGNHLALVKEGRAGPDVMVADAKPHFAAWRSPRWPRAARRTA